MCEGYRRKILKTSGDQRLIFLTESVRNKMAEVIEMNGLDPVEEIRVDKGSKNRKKQQCKI